MASLIAFGAEALGTSLRALHSTVSGDVGKLRDMSTAWPSYLLDLEERRGQEPDQRRVRYTPRQLERAERLCTLFVGMGQFSVDKRRCAVIRALRPQITWASLASQVNAYALKPAARERLGNVEKIVNMRDGSRVVERRVPRPAGVLMSWQECRGAHDMVLATYAYKVCESEGLEVNPVMARERAS